MRGAIEGFTSQQEESPYCPNCIRSRPWQDQDRFGRPQFTHGSCHRWRAAEKHHRGRTSRDWNRPHPTPRQRYLDFFSGYQHSSIRKHGYIRDTIERPQCRFQSLAQNHASLHFRTPNQPAWRCNQRQRTWGSWEVEYVHPISQTQTPDSPSQIGYEVTIESKNFQFTINDCNLLRISERKKGIISAIDHDLAKAIWLKNSILKILPGKFGTRCELNKSIIMLYDANLFGGFIRIIENGNDNLFIPEGRNGLGFSCFLTGVTKSIALMEEMVAKRSMEIEHATRDDFSVKMSSNFELELLNLDRAFPYCDEFTSSISSVLMQADIDQLIDHALDLVYVEDVQCSDNTSGGNDLEVTPIQRVLSDRELLDRVADTEWDSASSRLLPRRSTCLKAKKLAGT